MSNIDEQRGDWFNLTASYTRIQGVGSDVVYDYLMPAGLAWSSLPFLIQVSTLNTRHKNKLWTNEDGSQTAGLTMMAMDCIDIWYPRLELLPGNSLGINVDQDTLEVTKNTKYLELKKTDVGFHET